MYLHMVLGSCETPTHHYDVASEPAKEDLLILSLVPVDTVIEPINSVVLLRSYFARSLHTSFPFELLSLHTEEQG